MSAYLASAVINLSYTTIKSSFLKHSVHISGPGRLVKMDAPTINKALTGYGSPFRIALGASINCADLSRSQKKGYLSAPMGFTPTGGSRRICGNRTGLRGLKTSPPGTSMLSVMAQRLSTARMFCTPLLLYSRPVYMCRAAPLAPAMDRASSSIVSRGTRVIFSTLSGGNCCT